MDTGAAASLWEETYTKLILLKTFVWSWETCRMITILVWTYNNFDTDKDRNHLRSTQYVLQESGVI